MIEPDRVWVAQIEFMRAETADREAIAAVDRCPKWRFVHRWVLHRREAGTFYRLVAAWRELAAASEGKRVPE